MTDHADSPACKLLHKVDAETDVAAGLAYGVASQKGAVLRLEDAQGRTTTYPVMNGSLVVVESKSVSIALPSQEKPWQFAVDAGNKGRLVLNEPRPNDSIGVFDLQ